MTFSHFLSCHYPAISQIYHRIDKIYFKIASLVELTFLLLPLILAGQSASMRWPQHLQSKPLRPWREGKSWEQVRMHLLLLSWHPLGETWRLRAKWSMAAAASGLSVHEDSTLLPPLGSQQCKGRDGAGRGRHGGGSGEKDLNYV